MKKFFLLIFSLSLSLYPSYGEVVHNDPLSPLKSSQGIAKSPSSATGTPADIQRKLDFLKGLNDATTGLKTASDAVETATGGGNIVTSAINVPLAVLELTASASTLAAANFKTTDWASLVNDIAMFGHNLTQFAQQTALAEQQVRTLLQSRNAQDALRTGSSMISQYYRGFGPVNSLIQESISNYNFSKRVFEVLSSWSINPNFPTRAVANLASLTTAFLNSWLMESTELLNMIFNLRDRTVAEQEAKILAAIRRSEEAKATIAAQIAALHAADLQNRQRRHDDAMNKMAFLGSPKRRVSDPRKIETKSDAVEAAEQAFKDMSKSEDVTPDKVAKETFTSEFWSQLIHIIQMLVGMLGAVYLLVNYFLKGKHDPQHHDSMFKVFIGIIIAIVLLTILSEVIIPIYGKAL